MSSDQSAELSSSNLKILSLLGMPAYLHEESVQVAREKEKLIFIRDTIEKCQGVSESMHRELDEFEERMQSLESVLQPIDADTRDLVTAGQRLDSVVNEVTQIIDNYALAHESDLQVQERRIEIDYKGYLEWVAALHVAASFWSRNASFKHADRTLRRIKELLRKAISECQLEFDRIMNVHTRVPDISKLPWPLPDSVELIPANVIDRLASVAQSLDAANNRSYLDSLQQHRGAFLKAVLKRTIASGYNPYMQQLASESRAGFAAAAAAAGVATPGSGLLGGAGVGSLALAASVVHTSRTRPLPGVPADAASVIGAMHSRLHGPARADAAAAAVGAAAAAVALEHHSAAFDTAAPGKERLGRYVRGTHRAIFMIDLALRLWELEAEAWYRIVQSTALEADDFDDRLAVAMAEPLDLLLRSLDGCLRERTPNRMLHMLDLMGHLNTNLPRFRAVLKKGLRIADQYGKVTELRRQVADAVATAVREQRAAIDDYRPDNSALARASSSGAVSALTVDTLTLLGQLAAYADVVNGLSDSLLHEGSGAIAPDGAGKSKAGQSSSSAGAPTAAAAAAAVDDEDAPLVQRLTRMFLHCVERNLETQAHNHHARSPALAALFLLNNYHHVFRSAAKAGLALDRDLEARYLGKMREAQASYTAATWARVLMYLSVDDAPAILAQCKGSVVPDGTKPAIKRKFAGFNNTFDELYRTHRTYSIPDADLRAQLRAANIDLILPRYKAFLATYENLSFSTKPGKYVQYSLAVLESSLNKFYDETA